MKENSLIRGPTDLFSIQGINQKNRVQSNRMCLVCISFLVQIKFKMLQRSQKTLEYKSKQNEQGESGAKIPEK